MNQSVQQFLNYTTTFLVLTVDFIRSRFLFTFLCMIGIALAGLLHPLPLASIAAAVFAAVNGKDAVTLNLGTVEWSIPIIEIVVMGLAVGLITYVMNFGVTRLLIGLNIRWQHSVFWRLLNELGTYSRIGRVLPVLPDRLRLTQAVIERSANACTRIGRLVTQGLHSVIVILVTLLAMLVLDWRVVAVLAGSVVLLLPVYARVVVGMVSVRANLVGEKIDFRARILKTIEEVSLNDGFSQASFRGRTDKRAGVFAPVYSITNNLYFSLNTIHLLVVTHFFVSTILIFILLQPHRTTPDERDIFLFAALLIFVRSVMGLLGLMGNLTRNYSNISVLKQLLYPPESGPAKKIQKDALLRAEMGGMSPGDLIVEDRYGAVIRLSPGELILLRSAAMPKHSYGLSVISNSAALFQPSPDWYPAIPVITRENIHSLERRVDAAHASETLSYEIEEMNTTLDIKRSPYAFSHKPVICMTEGVYRYLMRGNSDFPEILENTVCIIWLPFGGTSEPWPLDMPAIRIDMDGGITITNFEAVKDDQEREFTSKALLAAMEKSGDEPEDAGDELDDF